MLVLSRKLGEKFVIEPAGITVTIVGFMAGNVIRVGIDAPQNQIVLRGELVGRYGKLQARAEKEERERKEGSV
jgi:carbon storage regulator CsrA